jgi:hypothetical protein
VQDDLLVAATVVLEKCSVAQWLQDKAALQRGGVAARVSVLLKGGASTGARSWLSHVLRCAWRGRHLQGRPISQSRLFVSRLFVSRLFVSRSGTRCVVLRLRVGRGAVAADTFGTTRGLRAVRCRRQVGWRAAAGGDPPRGTALGRGFAARGAWRAARRPCGGPRRRRGQPRRPVAQGGGRCGDGRQSRHLARPRDRWPGQRRRGQRRGWRGRRRQLGPPLAAAAVGGAARATGTALGLGPCLFLAPGCTAS